MLVCALVLGGLGLSVGLSINNLSLIGNLQLIKDLAAASEPYHRFLVGALAVLGALFGFIIGPKLAQSIVNLGNAIEKMSTRDKVSVGIGTFLGIVVTLPFFLLLMPYKYVGIPISILRKSTWPKPTTTVSCKRR